MNVYVGGPVVISDMQGPCEYGFHVPLRSEWASLISTWTSLTGYSTSNGSTFATHFNLPFAGQLYYSSGNIANETHGYYWCSNTKENDSTVGSKRYMFHIVSNYIYDFDFCYDSYGLSIRPFKDEAVIPDSNWTTVYQGTGTAGVYHNSDLGLISISSNGTTWITISDKNLGATEVYQYGSNKTQANSGNKYQWGNNYGFTYNGSGKTTSSTLVDASTYGPGNYYNNSTFITVNNSPYGWDSSNNHNLRGGVSQGTSTKGVELKNAYIGEYISTLEYDFTQSDAGWTKSSTVSRSSSGFYVSGANVDGGLIVSPSEVYQKIPKKIKIYLNRNNTSNTGTGIWNNGINSNYWYFLPRNSTTIRLDWSYHGTVTQNSVSLGTGDITWELDIDSSTTNWTVTHKITGNNYITDTGGVLKAIWENQLFGIRLIYWNNTSGVGPYIKKVTIEY